MARGELFSERQRVAFPWSRKYLRQWVGGDPEGWRLFLNLFVIWSPGSGSDGPVGGGGRSGVCGRSWARLALRNWFG